MNTFNFIFGTLIGYGIFMITSHPKSRIHRKLPHKSFKNFSFLPSIKIRVKKRQIHLHHWFNMSAIYLIFLANAETLRDSNLFHGFFIGSIIQGLILKDRFSFIKKVEEQFTYDKEQFLKELDDVNSSSLKLLD